MRSRLKGVAPEIETGLLPTLWYAFPLTCPPLRFFYSWMQCLIIHSVVLDSWMKGIWSRSQVMVMHVWTWLTAPTQPQSSSYLQGLELRGARHTLIPQHPDLSKPVVACPQQTWQPVFSSRSSAFPARSTSPCSHSAMGGLGIWVPWHCLFCLCELMLHLKPGTKAVSAN